MSPLCTNYTESGVYILDPGTYHAGLILLGGVAMLVTEEASSAGAQEETWRNDHPTTGPCPFLDISMTSAQTGAAVCSCKHSLPLSCRLFPAYPTHQAPTRMSLYQPVSDAGGGGEKARVMIYRISENWIPHVCFPVGRTHSKAESRLILSGEKKGRPENL